MKTFRDNKGFTLIELLAVIVVLAIVTVIATRSVLPYMKDAGKDSFVVEANTLKGGATDAMSLMSLGKAGSNYSTKAGEDGATLYCFTLDNLKALGQWDKQDDNYGGRVVVKVPANSNAYEYKVTLHSETYYVDSVTGTVKNTDVKDYKSVPSTVVFDCTSY